MTDSGTVSSGYILESVVFPVQRLVTVQAPIPAPEHEVSWGWDWRWLSADQFEVGLVFEVTPSQTRPEQLEVAAAAVFRLDGDVHTVEVASFAHTNAPALLFPYLRQAVDALTSRGAFGRVLLPPTNMVSLMTKFDMHDASGHVQTRPEPTS